MESVKYEMHITDRKGNFTRKLKFARNDEEAITQAKQYEEFFAPQKMVLKKTTIADIWIGTNN